VPERHYPPSSMRLLSRVVLPAVAGVGVLALTGCHTAQHNYDDATREAFMAVCRQGKNAPSDQVCGCYYNQLTQELKFDDFAKLDHSMQNDPNFTPDVVLKAVSDCSNGGVVPSSPPAKSNDRSDATDQSAKSSPATDRTDAGSTSDSSDGSVSDSSPARSGTRLSNLPGF
jgi:hypothetical protein